VAASRPDLHRTSTVLANVWRLAAGLLNQSDPACKPVSEPLDQFVQRRPASSNVLLGSAGAWREVLQRDLEKDHESAEAASNLLRIAIFLTSICGPLAADQRRPKAFYVACRFEDIILK
jgi:hypothetical protein